MDTVAIPFDIDLDDSFNGVLVEKFSFAVGVGGVTPNSGWVRLDGHSLMTIPTA